MDSVLTFLKDHWGVIFSGIGTAIIVAVFFNRPSKKVIQKNIKAGRDVIGGDKH